MENVKSASIKGTFAVRKLRDIKLRNGLPFMINAKELATNECYLEYPDGSMKLVFVIHSMKETKVIRELTSNESNLIRNRFKFS